MLGVDFLIPSLGSSFAQKVILSLRFPEIDSYGSYLPFLIQLLFEFELFHFCILSLLGMTLYTVLIVSGGFQVVR
jgi:hypothetical protein